MKKEELGVGMAVKVFDVNSRTHGQPGEGWDGTVTSVRRTQCTIEYRGISENFEIDSQVKANDSIRHRYFRTVEQAEAANERRDVLERLKKYKIYASDMRDVSTQKLQAIAEILEAP